tara:strand:+ start:325 stop:522 length:198 start_codon:yes stop_codon:yes gene_type:complete
MTSSLSLIYPPTALEADNVSGNFTGLYRSILPPFTTDSNANQRLSTAAYQRVIGAAAPLTEYRIA